MGLALRLRFQFRMGHTPFFRASDDPPLYATVTPSLRSFMPLAFLFYLEPLIAV
jgi:hypothetical protein